MAWKIIDWLLGRKSQTKQIAASADGAIHLTHGAFFDVVGESFYQPNLEAICGGRKFDSARHQCRAYLIPEPDNPADPNAIKIVINRLIVGHLARDHAIEYHQHIGARISTCEAKIVGGWDDGETVGHFGVKLKIKWPPRERKKAAKR